MGEDLVGDFLEVGAVAVRAEFFAAEEADLCLVGRCRVRLVGRYGGRFLWIVVWFRRDGGRLAVALGGGDDRFDDERGVGDDGVGVVVGQA